MSAQFGLFLGENRIPVINWINRHGSPEGRELRFTLPTEAKAKIEANLSETFRLERDGKAWDFEILKVTQHGTGTNGLPAVGRVKAKGLPGRPKSAVGIPKLETVSEASASKPDPSALKNLLLKKKADAQAPVAAEPAPPTEKGHPAVVPGAATEEE